MSIPVSTASRGALDLEAIRSRVDDLTASFRGATPFRYFVVDDCLTLDRGDVAAFPDAAWPPWRALGDAYQHEKRSCADRAVIPEPWGQTLDELNSPAMLRMLEQITGIDKLLPDPYLEGGGLHLSTPGGILAPHTDFHVYSKLDLYRRLNALLYLNPEWTPGDGGELELSHAKRSDLPTQRIEPVWGRLVVFETNDISVHGFTEPVATGRLRRSLAVYYYTAAATPGFSGDATTHWRDHLGIRARQRPRFWLSRALMQTSRAFSLLAHLANPNQGRAWWRWRKGRST